MSTRHAEVPQRGCCVPCRVSVRPCAPHRTSDQPTRILSTDKKAQKAGGLCLALKGVPVKPTDDVDVEKEYQLIPLDSL